MPLAMGQKHRVENNTEAASENFLYSFSLADKIIEKTSVQNITFSKIVFNDSIFSR